MSFLEEVNLYLSRLMGLGNIYKRRIKVFALALLIYLDYKALQQRSKWVKSKTKKASLWKKAHERNARRLLYFMIEMEGLWVKFGQYLSTRADVLPEAYIRLLQQLQDSLPPRPLEEVCHTIEKELGKSVEELFSEFVKAPLATASIAQVHRATLLTGQEVVVKVQHEGIKHVIIEDLKNAKSIVEWIAWAEPVYNFNPMIDEWCKEAPKELDFNIEAENTRKVASNLGCNKINNENVGSNHIDVLIPEVIQSAEKVIILEYMDGVRLNDFESLQALGVDRKKLVEEITRAYAHQIYVDGFFNGDPHPGNFLVSKEFPHRPILLDFGLTKSLPVTTKQALAKMLLASVEGDQVALLSAFSEMGLKLRMDLPEQAMEVTTIFFRSSTPASEAPEALKKFAEERAKKMKTIQEKMQLDEKEAKRFNPIDAFPGDIVIFSRVLNLLRGLSATMDVRIIYFDIMKPFAESVLGGIINKGPSVNRQWIFDTPVHSVVEDKLRKLLIDLGNAGKILEVSNAKKFSDMEQSLIKRQSPLIADMHMSAFLSSMSWKGERQLFSLVCAYKDGEVIIDTAAGVLGKYDPRPVQPDSLFPVFSVTKGIVAGLLHWLVDKRFTNHLMLPPSTTTSVTTNDHRPPFRVHHQRCCPPLAPGYLHSSIPDFRFGRFTNYSSGDEILAGGGMIQNIGWWGESGDELVTGGGSVGNLGMLVVGLLGILGCWWWVCWDARNWWLTTRVLVVCVGLAGGGDFMLRWLVDGGGAGWWKLAGKLKLDENIANIWPDFASNNKENIKVHHVLNHTSGLHNALANIMRENPLLVSDWNECLQRIAGSCPESEPGKQQLYHYLSFGWLCGGIIEHATGKKFQDILQEVLIHPLHIEGEMYIGVEARLAALTLDTDDLEKLSALNARSDLPSTFQPSELAQVATALPVLFNSLPIRRAIIPAANGHCSARALARYYACLADHGTIPESPSSSLPPLGSHTHIPKFPPLKPPKKENGSKKTRLSLVSLCRTMMSEKFNYEKGTKDGKGPSYDRVPTEEGTSSSVNPEQNTNGEIVHSNDHQRKPIELFSNPKIHDAFMGLGEYEKFVFPNGDFGLGFKRITSVDGSVNGFGHSGMGGSTGFCDVKNRFAIAITLNKMSFGGITGQIIQLVCSELNIPLPKELKGLGSGGDNSELANCHGPTSLDTLKYAAPRAPPVNSPVVGGSGFPSWLNLEPLVGCNLCYWVLDGGCIKQESGVCGGHVELGASPAMVSEQLRRWLRHNVSPETIRLLDNAFIEGQWGEIPKTKDNVVIEELDVDAEEEKKGKNAVSINFIRSTDERSRSTETEEDTEAANLSRSTGNLSRSTEIREEVELSRSTKIDSRLTKSVEVDTNDASVS
ncbi:hypothetical protein KSS87_019658 [Heliosperma pusillum]|nr:hypothetical protein KSS87_019658 [Heliosperma pusillum]